MGALKQRNPQNIQLCKVLGCMVIGRIYNTMKDCITQKILKAAYDMHMMSAFYFCYHNYIPISFNMDIKEISCRIEWSLFQAHNPKHVCIITFNQACWVTKGQHGKTHTYIYTYTPYIILMFCILCGTSVCTFFICVCVYMCVCVCVRVCVCSPPRL